MENDHKDIEGYKPLSLRAILNAAVLSCVLCLQKSTDCQIQLIKPNSANFLTKIRLKRSKFELLFWVSIYDKVN